MKTLECPKLCETCPIRDRVEGEPKLITEIGYSTRGEISEDGRSASFEFHYGLPAGERTSTIGIIDEKGKVASSFYTDGDRWDNGAVIAKFENCKGPVQKKYGFLNRKRYIACMAIENL